MKPILPTSLLLMAAAMISVGTSGHSQILRVDLQEMVQQTDGAVIGTIVSSETIRIDHPIDGPELYYTTLFVEGRSIVDGQPTTIGVSFPGGFVDAENGVYNSEAPAANEIAIGNQVVVFHKWSDNMGGDFASNTLFASHGGVYTTFENRAGQTIVQGRGEGYAIQSNVSFEKLEGRIRKIAAQAR